MIWLPTRILPVYLAYPLGRCTFRHCFFDIYTGRALTSSEVFESASVTLSLDLCVTLQQIYLTSGFVVRVNLNFFLIKLFLVIDEISAWIFLKLSSLITKQASVLTQWMWLMRGAFFILGLSGQDDCYRGWKVNFGTASCMFFVLSPKVYSKPVKN